MDVVIEIRNPLPPHEMLGETRAAPGSLKYGWALNAPSMATFTDPSTLVDLFGMMISLRRRDGYLPWAGFVTNDINDLVPGTAQTTAKDHAGALLAKAAAPVSWQPLDAPAARLIGLIFADADARADPPLLLDIDANDGGLNVRFEARGEKLTDVLTTLAAATGWEWTVAVALDAGGLGGGVTATLRWRQQLGRDLRNAITFEEGSPGAGGAFVEARLTRDASAYITRALAVGGTGAFRDRVQEELNLTGLRGEAAGTAVADAPAVGLWTGVPPLQRSPALRGSAVAVLPQVTNRPALKAAAQRLFAVPHDAPMVLEAKLFEGAVDMAYIELGAVYTVRFAKLVRGIGLESAARLTAFTLGEDGVIDAVLAVLPNVEPQRSMRPAGGEVAA